MAKRIAIQSKEVQLVIVGKQNFLKLPRVQKNDVSTDSPTNIVDELGNSAHAGESKDVPNVTVTFSAMDVGVKIWSVLTGTDWTAYPALGVDVANLGEVDIVQYIKSDTVADYVKSIHARKLRVRDFSFSYSVDGDATEDYTLVGNKKRVFAYDVIVDRAVTGTTSFTLSQTPIQLKNGNRLLSVIMDGVYLTEKVGTLATGEYSVSGTTVTTFDSRTAQVEFVYHANPAGTAWVDVSDTSMPASVRGKDIAITIGNQAINRVQSVTINGNTSIQAVPEMGNKDKIAGYSQGVPDITGVLSVLDTDTKLISLFTTGVVSSGVEWAIGEGCTTNTIPLKIEIQDPCDDIAPYTVLKTVYADSIAVNSESWSSTVNGNATQNFNFRSTTGRLVVYSGAM